MNRRRFTAGLGVLALPGCATTASRHSTQNVCLPRVDVSPGRVIRTVAGLRPYRDAGFVVRREALGDKALVHNYGHGGAGITLSWGSSRLATQLGLPGHAGAVAVIGAGIMGLTTARLVQEAGFAVTIYTAALPPETTSNIAGGQISPYGHYRDSAVTPLWRDQFRSAMEYSWRRFQIMVGDEYGIRWLPTYERGKIGADWLARYYPGARELTSSEHPFPYEQMVRYQTMYVETGRFLHAMTEDVLTAGGRLIVRRFAAPAELAALPERLIINCTGMGARDLFGDADLIPVRGQLAILVPQPEISYAMTGDGYMFPRADGILLGGTFERGEERAEPQPADIERIVEGHRRLFAGFRCAA